LSNLITGRKPHSTAVFGQNCFISLLFAGKGAPLLAIIGISSFSISLKFSKN